MQSTTVTVIEVVSPYELLVRAAARVLRGLQGVQVKETVAAATEVALCHAPGASPELPAPLGKVTQLLKAERKEDPSLSPGVFRLLLGTTEEDPFDKISLHLKANVPELKEGLEEELIELMGKAPAISKVTLVRRTTLLYGGASRFARRAFQLVLLARGIEVCPKREWDPSDQDIFLNVCAPELAARPPTEHNPLHIYTDDPGGVAPVLEALRAAGYLLELRSLDALASEQHDAEQEESEALFLGRRRQPDALEWDLASWKPRRFGAALDILDPEYGPQREEIKAIVSSRLSALGVSPEETPLENMSDFLKGPPCLVLPLGLFRAGQLTPYGQRHASRYTVWLPQEPEPALQELQKKLAHEGFSRVLLEPGKTTPRGKPAWSHDSLPPRISWPEPAPSEDIKLLVRTHVQQALQQALGEAAVPLEEREETCARDTIRIDLPLGHLQAHGLDGLLRRVAAQLDVQIFGRNTKAAKEVAVELRARGFRNIEMGRKRGRSRVGIFHGQAPSVLLSPLCSWMQERFGEEIPLQQVWGSHDRDVHIWLPELPGDSDEEDTEPGRHRPGRPGSSAPPVDLEAWIHGEERLEPRRFLEHAEGVLQVGDLLLPRPGLERHPYTPSLDSVRHYVLDGTTAATVRLLASATALREPCLLEGETCTSKTSAVLFLAAHLGQPVIRLNLNGQTDTSELIGRHVPATDGPATWCWRDGLVVEAMTRGYWLLLDELNLAEPQILERLNPLLERDPSLVLSEHDGRVIGAEQVHPSFRIFATMNPATYAGRSPLSPAFRDRFRAIRHVPPPSEHDLLTFLRAVVQGEGTELCVAGRRYQPSLFASVYPSLSSAPSLHQALPALARFHASVTSAFRTRTGPGSRERHAFTRRSLLSLLDFLSVGEVSEARFREALVRYYVERVPPEDQSTMVQLLDASGLGPGTWTPSAPSQPSPPDSDEVDPLAGLGDLETA